jgi:hypothetical protein
VEDGGRGTHLVASWARRWGEQTAKVYGCTVLERSKFLVEALRQYVVPDGSFSRQALATPDSSKGLPRDKQVANHDLEPDLAEAELRAAGFEVVERDDAFIRFTACREGPGRLWRRRSKNGRLGSPRS